MAKSVRKGPEGTIEEYPERTAAATAWQAHLNRRANRQRLPRTKLDDLVKAGALRLGLRISCPNCKKQNWYGLSGLGPRVSCERCLKDYDFPQGSLKYSQTPWRFRVAGPYSVPDFAGGAYATVLAIRVFSKLLGMNGAITYSTNLDLRLDGNASEIDFAVWYRRGGMRRHEEETVLVLGEAKSLAAKAIRDEDVRRLRSLAAKLPGVFLVFAVLKDGLSRAEKQRLSKLALWGRVPLPNGGPRAPVIVLTGLEMFAHRRLEDVWEGQGGKHAKFTESQRVRLDSLWALADMTQQLYLGLSSTASWEQQRFERKLTRRRNT
jgi:hypothetical protein